ncbi:MAG: hypothetical protein HY326_00965, partial [Chloroflexi bacterium]|nr:hypothetical protein [Chloroflexota bacterium]
DNTVFVADSGNQRIKRFTSRGELLGQFGSPGFGNGQFQFPMAVVTAPDDTIYVADQVTSRIQRFTADGAFLGKWGAQGSGNGQFNQLAGLAVAPNGNVYVADYANNRIQFFTATGDFLGKWAANSPSSVAVAPNGVVYVTPLSDCQIQWFSPTGTLLGRGIRYCVVGYVDDKPTNVAVAPDGSLFALMNFNAVYHFDAHANAIIGLGRLQAERNRAIAVGPDSVIYLVSSDGIVQQYATDGKLLRVWGHSVSDEGHFHFARNAALAPDSTLYVTDIFLNRILHFDAQGKFLNYWAPGRNGDEQLHNPGTIAFGPDKSVYVVDGGVEIKHFAPDGAFLGKWGSYGTEDGQFQGPNLDVAPDGTVFVSDFANHRIQYFSATGQFLGKWGSRGEGDGQFSWPKDVAVAPDGTVYVVDISRVQYFTADGAFLGKWGASGDADGQFSLPFEIIIAPDNTVFVVDWGNKRIQRFTRTGAFLGKWAISPSPEDMAMTVEGTAFVVTNAGFQVFAAEYPSQWRTEFFGNRWQIERTLVITDTATVDYDWGLSAPDPALPSDGFSARFTGFVPSQADYLGLRVQATGGVCLWVDGQLWLDRWNGPSVSAKVIRPLAAGTHTVQLEYRDTGGAAAVSLQSESLILPFRTQLPLVGR